MKILYKRILVITLFIVFNSFLCFANSMNCSNCNLKCLCNSSSYVPQEEAPVYIGGGFFSYFEGKPGVILCPRYDFSKIEGDMDTLYNDESACYGQFALDLKKMQRCSPYCYSLDGRINMTTLNGKKSFEMEKLDYVFDENDQQLYYRIRCSEIGDKELNKNSVYFFGSVCDDNCPVLMGNMALISENNIIKESYAFYIKGRDCYGAECQRKKMIRLTALNS